MSETMESLFAGMEEIPDDFFEWIKKDEQQSNIIYYQRNGKVADYWCCQCGKQYQRYIVKPETAAEDMVAAVVPRRDEIETCRMCGEQGRLMWRKSAGMSWQRMRVNFERYYLWQTDKAGNLVVRQFKRETSRIIHRAMNTYLTETRRIFMSPGMRKHYKKDWRTWNETKAVISKDYELTGLSFGGDSVMLEVVANSNMHYMPPDEYAKVYNPDACVWQFNTGTKVNVMMACARTPVVEMIHKMGLNQLARSILNEDGKCKHIYKRGTTAEKILRVKKEDVRWILQQPDEVSALRACQIARKSGRKVNDEARKEIYDFVFMQNRYYADEIIGILKFMSVTQAKNRINKFSVEYTSESSTIREYADYLRMRKANGYDMSNELYLNPRSLKETYKELRLEEERRKNENYIDQMMKLYTKIEKRFEKLDAKYHFETDNLMIRPAKNAGEIVLEGRTLHHCVGSSSQSYMKNHNDGRNVILFIRKQECIHVPYITVEIDKDFNVRQWYGENDTKPDEKEIEAFLNEYKAAKTEEKKTA